MRTFTTTLIAALSLGAPALAAPGTGGAAASSPPRPESVRCAEGCVELTVARPGSVVRVLGGDLAQVARVVFAGEDGGEDDLWTRPLRVRDELVDVVVPDRAPSGPLLLVTGDGVRSAPTRPIEIRPAGPAELTVAGGEGVAIDAAVESRRAFFDGRRAPALNFMVKGAAPAELTVTLVQAETNTPVATWSPGVVEPGTVRRIQWNGLDAVTRQAAPLGRYVFRVYEASQGARAAQARPVASSSFLFLDHVFPIRGPHDYGDEGAVFGAGRGGRSHQGHDVFAKCGTPLVAARGGKVKFAGWHSRAGNYLVIDGQATGVDYAYMHLQERPLVAKGDVVRTGDPIGLVGDTGVAHGCHLHFELWSAPGWYTGGSAIDPLPQLKAWDAHS